MGNFVFRGVGQAAMDMVIVGVAPVMAMSLAADRLMAALESYLARDYARHPVLPVQVGPDDTRAIRRLC